MDAFVKFDFIKEEAEKITDVLLLSDVYGIESHVNSVAEMKDLCDYLGLDSVEYLGVVNFLLAKQSSYK